MEASGALLEHPITIVVPDGHTPEAQRTLTYEFGRNLALALSNLRVGNNTPDVTMTDISELVSGRQSERGARTGTFISIGFPLGGLDSYDNRHITVLTRTPADLFRRTIDGRTDRELIGPKGWAIPSHTYKMHLAESDRVMAISNEVITGWCDELRDAIKIDVLTPLVDNFYRQDRTNPSYDVVIANAFANSASFENLLLLLDQLDEADQSRIGILTPEYLSPLAQFQVNELGRRGIGTLSRENKRHTLTTPSGDRAIADLYAKTLVVAFMDSNQDVGYSSSAAKAAVAGCRIVSAPNPAVAELGDTELGIHIACLHNLGEAMATAVRSAQHDSGAEVNAHRSIFLGRFETSQTLRQLNTAVAKVWPPKREAPQKKR